MPFISTGIHWKLDEEKEFVMFRQNVSTYKVKTSKGKILSSFSVLIPTSPMNETRVDRYPFSARPRRLPGEHLHQGKVFDRLGDKEVTNLQWIVKGTTTDNTLNELDALSGYSWSSGTSKYSTEISGIYAMNLGGSVYWVGNGDFSMTYYSNKLVYKTWDYSWDPELKVFRGIWRSTIRNGTSSGKVRLAVSVQVGYSDNLGSLYDSQSQSKVFLLSQDTANQCADNPSLLRSYLIDYEGDWAAYSRSPISSAMYRNSQIDLVGDTVPSRETLEKWYGRVNLCRAMQPITVTPSDKAELAQSLIDSINYFDGNLIAWIKDLSSIGGTISSLLETVGDWRNPRQWASLWLSSRFGDRLQIHDTMELLSSVRESLRINRKELDLYRARIDKETELVTPYHMYEKMYLSATVGLQSGLLGDMENLLAAPFRWDFALSLENVWDLVPFSFVVDWVYDVGSILNTLDSVVELSVLDVKTHYTGTRIETQCDLSEISDGAWSGSITRIWYRRVSENPLNWLRLKAFSEYLSSTVRPVNLFDATALLVQNLP